MNLEIWIWNVTNYDVDDDYDDDDDDDDDDVDGWSIWWAVISPINVFDWHATKAWKMGSNADAKH